MFGLMRVSTHLKALKAAVSDMADVEDNMRHLELRSKQANQKAIREKANAVVSQDTADNWRTSRELLQGNYDTLRKELSDLKGAYFVMEDERAALEDRLAHLAQKAVVKKKVVKKKVVKKKVVKKKVVKKKVVKKGAA